MAGAWHQLPAVRPGPGPGPGTAGSTQAWYWPRAAPGSRHGESQPQQVSFPRRGLGNLGITGLDTDDLSCSLADMGGLGSPCHHILFLLP